METVLVLGSNSFSGSDFVTLLLEETDYRIVGVSRSPEKSSLYLPYRGLSDLARFEFHRLDLNTQMDDLLRLLEHVRPEYVVNFASQSEVAPSWDQPEDWFQTNAMAVAALGNFLRKQAWLKRYVHISTPEVYGRRHDHLTEQTPFQPSTPYAASRAAAEMMLSTLVQAFEFPVVTIRSANVYGPHQQLFKIVPRSFIYIRLGRLIPLHEGGGQERSFIHVRDVSRGELAAMLHGDAGQAYNLATEQMTAIRELVREICAISRVDFQESVQCDPPRLGSDPAYKIDATKAHTALGWQPKIPLTEGLHQVHDWIDRYWDQIAGEPLEYVHQPNQR